MEAGSGSAAGPGASVVEVRAPAKVNLHLRVLARRESGFHSLETVLAAVELFDGLRVERTSAEGKVELATVGSEDVTGAPEANLAHRAARAYLERAGEATSGAGVRMELQKGIPAGAGLGGGSADAAFALRALDALFGHPLDPGTLLELAAALGSDVPFFLSPSPLALAWGRGERLLPLPAPPAAPLVLALPPVEVSTAWAFGELARSRSDGAGTGATAAAEDAPACLPPAVARGEWAALRGGGGLASEPAEFPVNDFEPVVFRSHPELGEVKRALVEAGARPARLSGSGGAVFGVFDSSRKAQEASRELEERFHQVNFVATRTLESFPAPKEG